MLSRHTRHLETIDARRVLLIKPSALGDIVHALPVLHALRERFPKSAITWLVNRVYAPLLEGHPDLDAVLPFDRDLMHAGWWGGACAFLSFLRELRRSAFDLVIDLQGLFRTGLMTGATGARWRLGLRSAREGARWAYSHAIDDLQLNTHAVDRYWRVAEALGVGGLEKHFTLPRSDEAERWVTKQLNPLPRPWLVMNLGTRWETKRWPAKHFIALAERVKTSFGGTILLVGTASEAMLGRCFCTVHPHGVVDLIGKTSLPELVAILERADVMVSNDSGPLHLAAALGRPVVAPFTCTSPARTGPYGQPAGVIATNVWCAASYLKTCSRLECMTELTPERLWPALQSILQPWKRQSA